MGFLSLTGIILCLSFFSRLRPEIIPYLAITAVSTLLYPFALFGHLGAGVKLLQWSGLASIIISLIICSLKRDYRERILSPGFVFFFAGMIVGCCLLIDAYYQNWDEFSHWGLATKEMLFSNMLPRKGGSVEFTDYPPAVNLFHCFFVINSGLKREPVTYMAHLALVLAPLSVLFDGLAWRDWKKIVPVAVFAPIITMALGHSLKSVYVDHVLSVHMAAILVMYFHMRKRPGELLLLAPMFFVLIMIKKTGALLAWFSVLIMMADQLLYLFQKNKDGSGLDRPWRGISVVCLLALIPLFCQIHWNARIAASAIEETFSLSPRLHDITALFTGMAPDVQMTIISNFVHKTLISIIYPGNLLITMFFFLFAFIYSAGDQKKTIALIFIGMLTSLVVYALGLLYMFLFSFSVDLGLSLCSYDRYMNTMYAAMALTGLGLLAGTSWKGRWEKSFIIAGAVLFGIFLWFQSPYLRWIVDSPSAGFKQDRNRIKEVVESAHAFLAPTDKVYIVFQSDTGFMFRIMKYELSPNPAQGWCWRMGKPYFEGDIWNCDKTPLEWANVLKDWDYVIIGDADQRFWNDYGDLFKERTDTPLYKVQEKKEKMVQLVPVPVNIKKSVKNLE